MQRLLIDLYDAAPGPIQSVLESAYYTYSYKSGNGLFGVDLFDQSEFVDRFFDSRADFETYEAEFHQSRFFEAIDEAGVDELPELGSLTERGYARLYALVRKRDPETIVETGVFNGLSSLCYLTALNRNGHGRLYSVDYPDEEGLSGPEPGWLIPDKFRDRWDLMLGRSQRVLPSVIAEAEPVDIFFHDSNHSAPCMMFEFELAREHLAPDGLILADAIYMSSGFWDFVNAHDLESGHVTPQVGYALCR